MIEQKEFTLSNYAKGFHLITNEIFQNLPKLPETGILNIFIKHTSAALSLNENADYTVRVDMENFFNKLIPENLPYFEHTSEGSDDMPVHIKSSIIGQSVTIPISNYKLNLGIWQGIYLCEFRRHGGRRKIVVTVYS
ncbi:MAG: secondary thiamine-phosphate synthase [Bacteroidetes bacterium GWA2_30_7]|nr:MAG: secondary thiamine-phosphate synthase [Bacteroidetes bacterium GWA2_30_7]